MPLQETNTFTSTRNEDVHKTEKGVVLWGTKNIYKVRPLINGAHCFSQDNFDIIECRLKGKRGDTQKMERTFLVAGDVVEFSMTDEGFGLIIRRIERKNSIIRKKNDTLQPITVNIDMLIIVASIQMPAFRPAFIDRLIYIANCEHIPVLLLLNKIDLVIDDHIMRTADIRDVTRKIPHDIRQRIDVYQGIDIDVAYTSTTSMYGVEAVKKKLQDKYVGIVGQSGVGKSSMINAFVPNAHCIVGDISEKYNRGRHTTTRPELIYAGNFCIIDTPGIRDLFPQEMDVTSLIKGFPEIFQYAVQCKLPNCSHRNEPQCAVITHIGKEIHTERYKSYISIRESMEIVEKTKWQRQKR